MIHQAEERSYHALLSKLNPCERKFVGEYLIHGIGNRAAIAAGYSPRTARVIALKT